MLPTALLIVAVIIFTAFVTYLYVTKYSHKAADDAPSAPSEAFRGHAAGCDCRKCMTPEGSAAARNLEYFNADAVAGSGGVADYGGSEFIGGSNDFKDYAMAQAVDMQTRANHSEFVADRLKHNPQNITGRTFTLGELESDNGVPWMGLRRGQAIPPGSMGNPTQVTDFRASDYDTKPRFTWASH